MVHTCAFWFLWQFILSFFVCLGLLLKGVVLLTCEVCRACATADVAFALMICVEKRVHGWITGSVSLFCIVTSNFAFGAANSRIPASAMNADAHACNILALKLGSPGFKLWIAFPTLLFLIRKQLFSLHFLQ